jgi:endoglucanase
MKKILLAGLLFCFASLSRPLSPDLSGEALAKPEALAQGGVPAPAMPGKNVPAIKVNTVGYFPAWTKIAIFNLEPKNVAVKTEEGQTVYKMDSKNIRSFGKDAASQDLVWQVDFSGLTLTGRYFIEGSGAKSDPFEIGPNLYEKTLQAAVKSFYFQRCRTALEDPYAKWEEDSYTRQGPCHAHDDVGWDLSTYPNKKKRWLLEAGWHDAGNFDMYVCSTAPTCQAMLLAFERRPDLFNDFDLNLPESGNKIPDILDECRWGLRWILSTQDKNGGFHARDAVMDWSPNGPADADTKTRWVAGVGTASTAKACAALALASKIYQSYDKPFAQKCRQAALQGWAFLKKNPQHKVVDGKGSQQPLWDDGADHPEESASRLAAAVELWRATGKPQYLEAARSYLGQPQLKPDSFLRGSWVNIARWPLVELATDPATPEDVKKQCKELVLAACGSVRERIEKNDGYRCAHGLKDYYWSSNTVLMGETFLLAAGAKLDPSQPWLAEAARDQWHWLLGRNPNGYSMVTRIGKGPDALYHCEWDKASRLPPPGQLTGGPNSHNGGFLAPEAPAKCLLWDNPMPLTSGLPAHHLWHSQQSDFWDGGFFEKDKWDTGWWVVTEPDINGNADLVLTAVEFQE